MDRVTLSELEIQHLRLLPSEAIWLEGVNETIVGSAPRLKAWLPQKIKTAKFQPATARAVSVYQLSVDSTLAEIFGEADLDDLALSEGQIVEFVSNFQPLLTQNGYSTFFPVKTEKGYEFVSVSIRDDDQGFVFDLDPLGLVNQLLAEYGHRFIF